MAIAVGHRVRSTTQCIGIAPRAADTSEHQRLPCDCALHLTRQPYTTEKMIVIASSRVASR